ncbi:MAG: ATP synthase F0 subunit C [bacterium]|nr:ATP synthase F0 subunit C [bacterium]
MIVMNRKILVITTAIIILTMVVIFANEATNIVTDVPKTVNSVELSDKLFKALSIAGLGFAAGGGAAGIGLLSKAFIEGIYRNPETTNKMLVWYFIAFALIEAQVLYTLFFVFQLFFAK